MSKKIVVVQRINNKDQYECRTVTLDVNGENQQDIRMMAIKEVAADDVRLGQNYDPESYETSLDPKYSTNLDKKCSTPE